MKLLFVLLCLLFSSSSVFGQIFISQQVIASSGVTTYNTSGAVVCTFGEVFIQSYNNNIVEYSEGFLTGYTPNILSVNDPHKDFKVTIYPNPTYGQVRIVVDREDLIQLIIVTSIDGIILLKYPTTSDRINLRYPAGNYFIGVLDVENNYHPIGIIQKIN